ncbi:hypothetical protein IJ843_06550 [bacterium]|nr:hypothetical protein [bacterium]
MGIIGVVAALTLPNLNSSTGDKEKIAKVKKIYLNLEDALGRAQAVYGTIEDWDIVTQENNLLRIAMSSHVERITEFMKISKDCGKVAKAGCFSSSSVIYLNSNKITSWDNGATTYKYILNDCT